MKLQVYPAIACLPADSDFESEEQRKGYLSFLQWCKEKKLPNDVTPIDLWFIQKDHESAEWFINMVGNMISNLSHQLGEQQCLLRKLQAEVETLKTRTVSETTA